MKPVRGRPGGVILVAFLFVLMALPLPVAEGRPGDALINPFSMSQDLAARQEIAYDQVFHVVTSYYLKFCTQISGGNCVQWESDFDWRIAGGWVEKRWDGFFDYTKSGLAWAVLGEFHQNVQTAFPDNGPRNGGQGVYYYYCPLDGSGDGANSLGFSHSLDGTPNLGGGYVTARYNVPNLMSAHVYRAGGTVVYNSVYAMQQFTFGDSRNWAWVPVCNEARHFLGRAGFEVRITLSSESMNVVCCFSIVRHDDFSDFRMNF